VTIHTANRKRRPRGAWATKALHGHNTHRAVFALVCSMRRVADAAMRCVAQLGESMAALGDALCALRELAEAQQEAQS
jgi:hypothetical protein